jgi:recombination protein RecA
MMYGEGISRESDLLDLASERGFVQKSGTWYAYQEDRIGQGRENAKKYLKEHPMSPVRSSSNCARHSGSGAWPTSRQWGRT